MIPSLHIVRQWKYRENFYEFFRKAWPVIEPTKPLVENWHLKYVADTMQGIVEDIVAGKPRQWDYVFNMPPGSTKSNLISVALPAWAWVLSPSFQIISTSYADTLAHYHAGKSRDIMLSDWYQRLFGDLFQLRIDINKKSEYANNKGGFRYSCGAGGSPIGRHADLLLCDDPMNPKKAASRDELANINTWWDEQLSTRVNEESISVKAVVMQRLAANDLSAHCLSKGNYRHICLPAERTKDSTIQPPELVERYEAAGGLLDPVRLGRPSLANFKVALGTRGYVGQMLQSPVKEGGNMVQASWFGTYTLADLQQRATEKRARLEWNTTIDTAYTQDEENDPTSLLTYCLFDNFMYVRDVAVQRLEMPDLLRFIPEFVQRNGYNAGASRIYIEPKASGLSTAQMMKRTTKLNIIIDKAPTSDKPARLNECLPYIESGRVLLLQGAAWVKPFIDEVCIFPNGDHDDQVDTLTMAVRRAIQPTKGTQVWHINQNR
jgi:predicted phage terminase large subunit-like protein